MSEILASTEKCPFHADGAREAGAPRPPHVPAGVIVDFDFLQPGPVTQFFEPWIELQRAHDGPLVWTPRNGGHWIVLRGKDVQEVYADHAHFSAEVQTVPRVDLSDYPRGLPTTVNPPEHGPYRAIINPLLGPKAVRDQEGNIRALAIELIEGFRARGECEFVGEFARLLPLGIFLDMIELPQTDREKLAGWTDAMTRAESPQSSRRAMESLMDYLKPIVRARRAQPGEDMISKTVNATIDGRPLTEEECLGLCFQLVVAGLDTVANLLGFMMQFLARHPEHRRALIAAGEITPGVVSEVLRRFPVVTMSRLVREDYVFRGQLLKAGDMIMIPSMLQNLDPDEYPDPMTVDFERKAQSITTFGHGNHRCPGAVLARTEIRIVLEEWLRRIPDFELAADEVTYGNGVVSAVNALPLRWVA